MGELFSTGLGCWIDSRTNNTWAVTPESAADRVCALMNHSVQEIDMFAINQGQATPTRPDSPEPFWIPQLEKFMTGRVSCVLCVTWTLCHTR